MPLLSGAQVNDLDMRLPMNIDADNTTIDGKNSMIIFSGLRLTQGNVSIQADEGRATRMELEDSTWHFSGNVIIDIGAGHIECDAAELLFDEFRLKQAIVTGSPALYDLQRPGTGEITHAEAGHLIYDVDAGLIEFSDEATITEGGNQISSSVLVYNITEQRINADSLPMGSSRRTKIPLAMKTMLVMTRKPGINEYSQRPKHLQELQAPQSRQESFP
jgi:lipopolysaccharide transport protein LptA